MTKSALSFLATGSGRLRPYRLPVKGLLASAPGMPAIAMNGMTAMPHAGAGCLAVGGGSVNGEPPPSHRPEHRHQH